MKTATHVLFLVILFFSLTCSLEKIDPSVKYDPCLGKVSSKFSHDKIGITCDSPCLVKFTNSSTGAKSYLWDFGEGGSSTEANPTYTFKKTGRFEVKLTATGDIGCTSISIEAVVVSKAAVPDPVPDFTITYLGDQTAPALVSFTNNSQNATKYKWTFGTGKDSSTQTSPQFTFVLADNFSVKLEATNSIGVTKQTIKTVTIKAITFKNTYALSNNQGRGLDVILTSDKGYAVTGSTEMLYVLNTLKVDAKGIKYWNTKVPSPAYSQGSSLVEAPDGSIISIGYKETVSSGTDGLSRINTNIQLVKLNKVSGLAAASEKIIEGPGGDNDGGSSIEKTSDGNYIICGSMVNVRGKKADIYWAKIDENLNIKWAFTYGDTTHDGGIIAKQTSDGGYVIFGELQSRLGVRTPVLIKTDAQGIRKGIKNIEIDVNTTSLSHMAKTNDGGYIFSGYIKINPLITNFVLHKTDSLGNKQWQYAYGDSRPLFGRKVEQCFDGSYVICGDSDNTYSLTESSIYVFKIDITGKIKIWDKTFLGTDPTIKQATDGGFIIAGSSYVAGNVGTLLIKTDKNGDVQ